MTRFIKSLSSAALISGMFLLIQPFGGALANETDYSSDPDLAAIEAAARDYIEGWFNADAGRMERSLSPKLSKRIVASELGFEKLDLVETSALDLVQGAGRKPSQPMEKQPPVLILDRFENAASVRVDAGVWIDYLHVAKIHGEWKIVNVLWEMRTTDSSETAE